LASRWSAREQPAHQRSHRLKNTATASALIFIIVASIAPSLRQRLDTGSVLKELARVPREPGDSNYNLERLIDNSTSFAKHATTIFFPHFVGDACTIAVIPDRTD
jgi:hypothetical protein